MFGNWARGELRMTPIFLPWQSDRQLFHPEKTGIFRLGQVDVEKDAFRFLSSEFEVLVRCPVVV